MCAVERDVQADDSFGARGLNGLLDGGEGGGTGCDGWLFMGKWSNEAESMDSEIRATSLDCRI